MWFKKVAFFLLCSTVFLNAGVVPDRWEKVEALSIGSSVIVSLKRGSRIEAKFRGLGAEAIALTDESGRDLQIPRPEVATITIPRGKDTLSNGALIGTGIGVGVALVVLAVAGSGRGEVLDSAKWGAPLLLLGLGAVVGTLIDRSQKGEQLIYKSEQGATRGFAD